MSDVVSVSDANTPSPVTRIYVVVLTVGIACALAIVMVHQLTGPIIHRNQDAFRQRAVLQVLPGATSSQTFAWDESTQTLTPLDSGISDSGDDAPQVFAGFDNTNRLVGIAVSAEGMGYQDVIRLLYGYSAITETVTGIQVLESRETPGLGDRIETDPQFVANFESLDVRLDPSGVALANPIVFVNPGKKTERWQVDGISGATISSRAVADMLHDSTLFWIPRLHRSSSQLPPPGETHVDS